ncbi:hypothetical protein SAMD00019534_053090 [Acytostelium subglobosum LB1]|uniref:hypothetical protein n=1 Tax=Acytostelium subglobosum LB1 TaxID=1410327 RepID=UPI000644BD55|nr:hypothetical protein SAMD00019534_053090 [Acytostelium subglobosum LB1]GAM22134.1 hypothetical protein SAMD00019534_053090 [Acytostelium subglobosum LB1]|eukprot:XP_012755234.1 hypothetical protein SAMD00019534_053090 [Acytostelium subglobosum LB1]
MVPTVMASNRTRLSCSSSSGSIGNINTNSISSSSSLFEIGGLSSIQQQHQHQTKSNIIQQHQQQQQQHQPKVLDINKDYNVCFSDFGNFNNKHLRLPLLSSTSSPPTTSLLCYTLANLPAQQRAIFPSSDQDNFNCSARDEDEDDDITLCDDSSECSSDDQPPEELYDQSITKLNPYLSPAKRTISISLPDLSLLSHQVAGQAPLFRLPHGKVLKPLVYTEYQFYKSLQCHTEFLDFTPKFYGAIDMNFVDNNPLDQSNLFKQETSIFDYNHWRNKVVNKPKEDQNLYIEIEDLTYLCKYPCILDLKMGVRQHGVGSTLQKIERMEKKCKATTSSSLGFRVCGLKVYNHVTGQYQTFDKFYGRSLQAQDIPMVIYNYLCNGTQIRVDLLRDIADRLTQLVRLFEHQRCYKFYGGSLLFIYDGASCSVHDSRLQVKMVDFAHASPTITSAAHWSHNVNHAGSTSFGSGTMSPSSLSSSSSPSSSPSQTHGDRDPDSDSMLDEGYLFGLGNLLQIINGLIISHSTTSVAVPVPSSLCSSVSSPVINQSI